MIYFTFEVQQTKEPWMGMSIVDGIFSRDTVQQCYDDSEVDQQTNTHKTSRLEDQKNRRIEDQNTRILEDQKTRRLEEQKTRRIEDQKNRRIEEQKTSRLED